MENQKDGWTGTALHDDQEREIVIPLHEEQISVTKRVVAKNRVQVARTTRESEQLVDEVLAREQVEVEHKAVGKTVETMPSVREEGDTIIIPVVEEILVIERKLFLKEEVHIRRVHGTDRHQERVTVRKQEATVTRAPVSEDDSRRDGD